MKNFETFLSSMSSVFVALILAGLAMPVKSYALPIADADGPYMIEYGMEVTFDASGSSAGGDYIVSWEWDLDNDGSYDDASGEIVTVNTSSFWAGPGDYEIGLKVTDWTNSIYGIFESDYDTASLTITEPIPEPTTMLLFGTGLAGLAAVGRRRKK